MRIWEVQGFLIVSDSKIMMYYSNYRRVQMSLISTNFHTRAAQL